jgi:hypothetical protein
MSNWITKGFALDSDSKKDRRRTLQVVPSCLRFGGSCIANLEFLGGSSQTLQFPKVFLRVSHFTAFMAWENVKKC